MNKSVLILGALTALLACSCSGGLIATQMMPRSGLYELTGPVLTPLGEVLDVRSRYFWVTVDAMGHVAALVDEDTIQKEILRNSAGTAAGSACLEMTQGIQRGAMLWIDDESGELFEGNSRVPALPRQLKLGYEWILGSSGPCQSAARISKVTKSTISIESVVRCGEIERSGDLEEWTVGMGRTRRGRDTIRLVRRGSPHQHVRNQAPD